MTAAVPLAEVLLLYASRDESCLVHEDVTWTWADLDRASDQWASELIVRGVAPNDLVAFTLKNSLKFFAVTFGIYKAGATPAPLSPKLPKAELDEILVIMRPATLVGEDDDVAGLISPQRLPVAQSWKACASGGSTGRPKVIVDHRPASFDPSQTFIGLPRDACVVVPGPLYHNAPFSAAVLALARGNRVVTVDRFDAETTLALIERHGAEWALLVPTMMHRILRLPAATRAQYGLSSLNTVVHTAAPMPAWLKQAWIDWLGSARIWEVYGATEGLVRTWIGGEEWLQRPGSVGRPIGGAHLAVFDEQGQEVAPGVMGEVFAMPPGGPASTYHYIGADGRANEAGWESVGDIGWVDAEGYLFLADRRTDLIISGGVNVFPAEVEAVILQHPRVLSCAVVGVPHEDLGQAVHAVVQSDDPRLDCAALRAFLAERLMSSKHPRTLEMRAEPVRDDAGKVRRGQLSSEIIGVHRLEADRA